MAKISLTFMLLRRSCMCVRVLGANKIRRSYFSHFGILVCETSENYQSEKNSKL